MKHSIFKSPLFALLLLVGGIAPGSADDAPAASSAPVPGLLYSNDFAETPINITENKWWTNTPELVTWEQDTIHDGKGAYKISNPDKTKNITAYGPFVPYLGPVIKLSIETKSTDVVTGTVNPSLKAAIQLYYYDQNKKEINVPWRNYHDILPIPDGSQDWQTYERTFTLPAATTNVAFVRIMVALPGSGSIWIDKVSLVQGP